MRTGFGMVWWRASYIAPNTARGHVDCVDGLTRRTAMPSNKKPHFKKKKKAVEDDDDAEIIDEGEYEGEGVLGFAEDVESDDDDDEADGAPKKVRKPIFLPHIARRSAPHASHKILPVRTVQIKGQIRRLPIDGPLSRRVPLGDAERLPRADADTAQGDPCDHVGPRCRRDGAYRLRQDGRLPPPTP